MLQQFLNEDKMIPRTPAEDRVFDAISDHIILHGYTPSLREIAALAGLKSIGTVQRHLTKLREKGYVDWAEGKKRTLRITDGQ
jgi:repressor LexA